MYIAAEPGGFFSFFSEQRLAWRARGLHEAASLGGEGDDGVGRMKGCFRAAFFFSYNCLRGIFAGEWMR